MPVTLDVPPDWRDRPILLRALELIGRHARKDPSAAPWLNSPALIAALGITRSPLPCLVIADKALRLNPRDSTAIVTRHLKAMTRAAKKGLDRLAAMEAERLRTAATIARMTRAGQLTKLAALLLRRPVATPLSIAQRLGLTVSGAGKLFARAADAGLVSEVTGRRAWKIYLPQSLALTFGYTTRSMGRPPSPPSPAPLESILS